MIGERGKREEMQRKKKRLILIETRDRVPVPSSSPRCHRHDSARLPKLCLDLNRSVWKSTYSAPFTPLAVAISSPEIFQRLPGIYSSRVTTIFFYVPTRRAVSLSRNLPGEYYCRNCIADQYKSLCIEFVALRDYSANIRKELVE